MSNTIVHALCDEEDVCVHHWDLQPYIDFGFGIVPKKVSPSSHASDLGVKVKKYVLGIIT